MARLNWEKATRRDVSARIRRESRERKGKLRRQGFGTSGPTEKQWKYIYRLSKELGIEPPVIATREGATATIGELKRRLERKERLDGSA